MRTKAKNAGLLLGVIAGAILTAAPAGAGILLGTGTLNNPADLTVIQTGGGVLEFLDLTPTTDLSVSAALSIYSTDDFRWANGGEVSELYDAFGITYSISPATFVDLGAAASNRATFLTYLGTTSGSTAALGWLDDLTTSTFHTYSCISTGGACIPDSFVNNTDEFWPSNQQIGVYLVRDGSEPVPEPATLFLLGGGLFGLATRRRRSS